MNEDKISQLKERVLNYIKQSSDYNDKQKLSIKCDADQFFILYGLDIQLGIAGFGSTPDSAYDDFVDNWHFYTKRQQNNQPKANS